MQEPTWQQWAGKITPLQEVSVPQQHLALHTSSAPALRAPPQARTTLVRVPERLPAAPAPHIGITQSSSNNAGARSGSSGRPGATAGGGGGRRRPAPAALPACGSRQGLQRRPGPAHAQASQGACFAAAECVSLLERCCAQGRALTRSSRSQLRACVLHASLGSPDATLGSMDAKLCAASGQFQLPSCGSCCRRASAARSPPGHPPSSRSSSCR